MQSQDKVHQKMDLTRSGDLPTNPTFVSEHQADEDADDMTAINTMRDQNMETEQDEIRGMSALTAEQGQKVFVWGSNSFGQLGLENGNFGRLDVP